MLKTIKTKKQMRLDELIKYIYNENIESKTFTDLKNEVEVSTNIFGSVSITNNNNSKLFVSHNRLFTVEIEEPIKDVTLLKEVVYVHDNEALIKDYDTSIDEILSRHHKGSVSEIHALINGRLELVYEREGEE